MEGVKKLKIPKMRIRESWVINRWVFRFRTIANVFTPASGFVNGLTVKRKACAPGFQPLGFF
jgi:hypothetical protein